MSNLVILVKALLGSKFDVRSFEAKNRVFELDHPYMNTFKFIRCSKNDVRVCSMFDKMVLDLSLNNVYYTNKSGEFYTVKLIFTFSKYSLVRYI